VPPELDQNGREIYTRAAQHLLETYRVIHQKATATLMDKLPRPAEMKPEAYARNIAARAFDVARYLLPFGIPTGVGQVTSIRTLERQVKRFKASPFAELREIANELAAACAAPADCLWDEALSTEPVAPTLARYADADEYPVKMHARLADWAQQSVPQYEEAGRGAVDLLQPGDVHGDMCATLLFPVTRRSYRSLYELVSSWPASRRQELLEIALQDRARGDELPREFRSAPFVFDIIMDIGAYRDLHRHRRCQQFRQQYSFDLGFETPSMVEECGAESQFVSAMQSAAHAIKSLPAPASQYLLPFGARSRFLFKMDFAELEYISRLRSGVKGHFSYRKIAWEMKQALERLDPLLGQLVRATPPSTEDPLRR